nr:hypothetical protein [Rhizobium sp. ACO-34A]
MEHEARYELLADENGWAMLIDGVQYDTYPSYHMAVQALRLKGDPEIRLRGRISFKVQTAGNHMKKQVIVIKEIQPG